MGERISRRAVLGLLPVVLGQKGRTQTTGKQLKAIPAANESSRLYDPATEALVTRLTAITANNFLPNPWQESISLRGKFLLFSSDRTSKPAPYLLDLKNGVPHQLAEPAAMEPRSLALDGNERLGYFLDGEQLKSVTLSNRREQVLADGVSGFAAGPARGQLVLRRGSTLEFPTGQKIAADADGPFAVAPSGRACWYLQHPDTEDTILWAAPLGGIGQGRPLQLARGRISFPYWSPDSQSVCYLRRVEGNGGVLLSEIRFVPVGDSPQEQTVAPTSQFASFAPNANASVYVGASSSKAQPDIMLLLRQTRRELTVCEHHASGREPVLPRFSPDSRRVYYESDREGKSALYSINVEQLVEST